jgi:drug/metabolite transporter (DMT)-like permease
MGIVLTLIVAGIWTLIARLYACTGERRIKTLPLLVVVTGSASVLSWLYSFICNKQIAAAAAAPLLLVMIAAGIVSQLGMLGNAQAMKTAPEKTAITWSIVQMAMIIPFLYATIISGERAYILQWLGVLLICLALVLNAPRRNKSINGHRNKDHAWFQLVLLTFILIGIGQTLYQEPSLHGWEDPYRLRAPLSLTAAAVFLFVLSMIRRQKIRKHHMIYGLLIGIFVAASNIISFSALDALGESAKTYLHFPLAVSGTILLYTVWRLLSRMEHLELKTAAGLITGVAGILLLTLPG